MPGPYRQDQTHIARQGREHRKQTRSAAPRRRPQGPAKPRVPGHEADLHRVMRSGEPVDLFMRDRDAVVTGTLIAFDSYTVTLENPQNEGKALIYYKSALECIVVPKKVAGNE